NYSLSQNFPNPFNPTTNIEFHIPGSGFVSLKVYDVLGREIATLVNEEKPAGSYEVEFNATSLSSGIYFYELKAGNFIQTRKMILIK
ncbi:MAG TPA: T9SS type A sorting domain-containing protein, partial [Ignavibacteriaceae bacterium]|nr:T9SS type A sorting domain-containing protein [Ignavibacteriaceae bacterium]